MEHLFSDKESHITNNGTFLNNEFKDIYLLKKFINKNKIKIGKDEVSEIKFVPIKELERLLDEEKEKFVPHDNIYKQSLKIFHRRYPSISVCNCSNNVG